MISREHLQLLGTITRKWGYEGELVIRLEETLTHLNKLPESVFALIDGRLVPFFFESARLHGPGAFIVKFSDLSNALIEKLLMNSIWFLTGDVKEKPDRKPDSDPDLAGFEVFDIHYGLVGVVAGILDRELQPLLVVMNGNTEILIPLSPEIITAMKPKRRRIEISAPDGLIDLYLNP
jgi:16S rRNA processing protein RimM